MACVAATYCNAAAGLLVSNGRMACIRDGLGGGMREGSGYTGLGDTGRVQGWGGEIREAFLFLFLGDIGMWGPQAWVPYSSMAIEA